MLGGRDPPPGNGLARHGGPLAIDQQRVLVDARLLDRELTGDGHDPEIDQIFLARIRRVVEFHVGKETIAVDGAGEIDVVERELQLIAVARIIQRIQARRSP